MIFLQFSSVYDLNLQFNFGHVAASKVEAKMIAETDAKKNYFETESQQRSGLGGPYQLLSKLRLSSGEACALKSDWLLSVRDFDWLIGTLPHLLSQLLFFESVVFSRPYN